MSMISKASAGDVDRDAIEALAADWLSRREGGLSAGEQAEFSRWLLEDARHAEAARRLESAWRYLQRPRLSGQAAQVEAAVAARVASTERRKRTERRRVALWSLGSLAAAAGIVMVAWQRKPVVLAPVPTPAVVSVEVRPERRLLADGTSVELNAGAEISVDYTDAARRVRLVRGEAHFNVAAEAARPFVVSAANVSVRAVGTAFSVRLDSVDVGVLVTEGRVAVERQREPAGYDAGIDTARLEEPVAIVDAGRRLTVPMAPAVEVAPPHADPVTPEEMRTALAWRGMRIEFTNMPLAEAVALFNRQNRIQLALGSPSLADLRISGIFWADDPEGFSRLVEASAGLRVTRDAEGLLVFGRE